MFYLNLWSNSKRIHLTIMFELIAIPYVTLNSVTFSIKCYIIYYIPGHVGEHIQGDFLGGLFFPILSLLHPD